MHPAYIIYLNELKSKTSQLDTRKLITNSTKCPPPHPKHLKLQYGSGWFFLWHLWARDVFNDSWSFCFHPPRNRSAVPREVWFFLAHQGPRGKKSAFCEGIDLGDEWRGPFLSSYPSWGPSNARRGSWKGGAAHSSGSWPGPVPSLAPQTLEN